MSAKKKSAPSSKPPRPMRVVRFHNLPQLERVKEAAASRGWTFNGFALRAMLEAAEYVLKQPRADGIFPDAPSMPVKPAGSAPSISDAA